MALASITGSALAWKLDAKALISTCTSTLLHSLCWASKEQSEPPQPATTGLITSSVATAQACTQRLLWSLVKIPNPSLLQSKLQKVLVLIFIVSTAGAVHFSCSSTFILPVVPLTFLSCSSLYSNNSCQASWTISLSVSRSLLSSHALHAF